MADEAFALSPISARATSPSEADYDAIREVFMETSRGRWFLTEFAKRNRNADTRMVLDAVARIEESLATPKNAPAGDLTEALANITTLINGARIQAAAALTVHESNEHLALAYKCVRTIREIAWTLRECGADSRICDKIDIQANTIDRSLDQFAAAAPRDSVLATFDDLIQRLDELSQSDTQWPAATSPSQHADINTASATLVEVPDYANEPMSDPTDAVEVVALVQRDVATAEVAASDIPQANTEAPAVEAVALDINVTPVSVEPDDADDADDIAVLDMIAMEMAAEDPEDIEDTPPFAAAATDIYPAPIESPARENLRLDSEMHSHASLGAALLANGTIRQPGLPGTGRFAAIQRLSQAEKVALFS